MCDIMNDDKKGFMKYGTKTQVILHKYQEGCIY